MKGFRSSPYTAADYDDLTESEKETLYNKLKNEDSESEAEDNRLKVHGVSSSERGSAY